MKHLSFRRVGIASACATFSLLSGIAAEETHTVAKGDLRLEVTLDAVVEAQKARPLAIDPKAWAAPVIVDVVPQGKRVRKGELLLRLDDKPLREEITQTERALVPAQVARQQGEAALRNLEATTPVQLAEAKRAFEFAAEALLYFEKTGRAQAIKGAKNGLLRAEQNLSYSEEELTQLVKMYEADDLTEETEEIIITRARNEVEAARFYLDSTRLGTERALGVEIPRQHEAMRNAKAAAEQAFVNARSSLPLALTAKRAEVDKLRDDERTLQKKLGELKADLALAELRSPADGIVGYGAAVHGKWATADAVAKKLVPGGKIAPKEVLFTIVETGAVRFCTTIPEDKLSFLRPGSVGVALPVFDPLASIPVRLTAVDFAPQATGGFLAHASVAGDATLPDRLTAGMNSKLKFVPVDEKDVLAIPVKAIRHGKDGPQVMVVGEDGAQTPVSVRTGATDGEQVVIRSGLKEGDKIAL